MILTSLRCFLNVLCPMTDKQTLLNANYYILDLDNPLYDGFNFDDKGNVERNDKPTARFAEHYNIKYGSSALNPQPYTSSILTAIGKPYTGIEDNIKAFVDHLSNSDTMYEVYLNLFSNDNEPQGNGLLIMIMYDEENVIYFGNIIASYLSQVFGVDVNFLDSQMRSDVVGNRDGVYLGNKQFGEQTRKKMYEKGLKSQVLHCISEHSKEETVNNLISTLSMMDFQTLINAYELIFPDQPLPIGNYQLRDIIDIFIGKLTSGIPSNPQTWSYEEMMNNIGSFESALSAWDDEHHDLEVNNYSDDGCPF